MEVAATVVHESNPGMRDLTTWTTGLVEFVQLVLDMESGLADHSSLDGPLYSSEPFIFHPISRHRPSSAYSL